MNQRILKKLAKKAIPVMRALNKANLCSISINEPDYDGVPIGGGFKFDRKHYDRNQSLAENYDFDQRDVWVIKANNPNRRYPFIRLCSPFESWPQVPSHSWRCCWEVAEYDCEDLWSALFKTVEGHFHDPVYREDGEIEWGYIPNMSNPRRVFSLARKILNEVAA